MPGNPRGPAKLTTVILSFILIGGVLYLNAGNLQLLLRPIFKTNIPSNAQAPNTQPPPDKTVPRPARPDYPDRPTVAVLDFGIDRDSWRGEQAAAGVAELIRQLIADDPAFRYVERNEIARVLEEHQLGFFLTSNPTDRLELGRWLNAHLIVTGKFRHDGENGQDLELTVVDAATAERVTRRSIPFTQPAVDLSKISTETISSLAEDVRELLHEAHDKLTASRNARIVSLLFFRNISRSDRLNHLEAGLADQLADMAEADSSVRLIRMQDPTLAMDEQELMLIGLSADNANIWQTAADYYMWGLLEEKPPVGEDGQPVQVSPGDLPVELTLVLWHGGEPIEIKELSPARDIENAVERAGQRVWQTVQGDLPKNISLTGRDKMVRLLLQSNDRLEVRISDAPDSWQVKRFIQFQERQQIAYFLDPENGMRGMDLVFFYPALGADQPWNYFRQAMGQVDRVVRRHGLQALDRRDGKPSAKSHDLYNERLLRTKLSRLKWMDELIEGESKIKSRGYASSRGFQQLLDLPLQVLPQDMPELARNELYDQMADDLIRLGDAITQIHADRPVNSRGRAFDPAQELFMAKSEVFSRFIKLNHVTPEKQVRVWDAWRLVLEPYWRDRYPIVEADVSRYDRRLFHKMQTLFTDAGRGEWYAMNLAPKAPPTADELARSRPEEALTPELISSLKQQIARLQDEGALKRPGKPEPVSPEQTEPPIPSVNHVKRMQGLINNSAANELVQQKIQSNLRYLKARVVDPERGPNSALRHAGAVLVEPDVLPIDWRFGDDKYLRFKDWQRFRPTFLESGWMNSRMYLLAGFEGSGGNAKHFGVMWPRTILEFDPLRLTATPLVQGLPENLRMDGIAAVNGRLWLATRQNGLVRYDPAAGEYQSFVGADGLSSRHISSVIHVDARLVTLDASGALSLVTDLDAGTPTFSDISAEGLQKTDRESLSAAGHTLLIGRSKPVWLNLDTMELVDVHRWIESTLPGDLGTPAWVKAGRDHFLIMFTETLVRVSSDLASYELSPTPVPPHEDMLIHDDGSTVWFAYRWMDATTNRVGRHTVTLDDKHESWHTRIVAWPSGTQSAIGQWQVDEKIIDVTSRDGVLYLIPEQGSHEVLSYHYDTLAEQFGVADLPYKGSDSGTASTPSDAAREAYAGDLDALKRRHDEGEDLDAKTGPDDWRPLLSAIRGGRLDAVRFLLDAGADPGAMTSGKPQLSPVILASMLNQPQTLDLLHQAGAALDTTSPQLGQPVHAAVRYGSYDSLAWLIEHASPLDTYLRYEPEPTDGPNLYTHMYHTRPLLIAIAQGDEQAMDMLLHAGADPTYMPDDDGHYVPALSYAILNGHTDLATRLMEAGALADQYDWRGMPPIIYAINRNDYEMVERLIDQGAVDPENYPELLLVAIHAGSRSLTQKLISKGYDPNTIPPQRFRVIGGLGRFDFTTAAHYAVSCRQIDLYDWLVEEHNIDLELVIEDHRQGDLLASTLWFFNYFDRALDLVAQGYSLNVSAGYWLDAPLIEAAKDGYTEEVRLLLRLGASPDVMDDDGKRPIDLAKNDAVRELLKPYE